jgi:hypothetical protein
MSASKGIVAIGAAYPAASSELLHNDIDTLPSMVFASCAQSSKFGLDNG